MERTTGANCSAGKWSLLDATYAGFPAITIDGAGRPSVHDRIPLASAVQTSWFDAVRGAGTYLPPTEEASGMCYLHWRNNQSALTKVGMLASRTCVETSCFLDDNERVVPQTGQPRKGIPYVAGQQVVVKSDDALHTLISWLFRVCGKPFIIGYTRRR